MTIADYPEVSPRTIWNMRQNSPELIVRDLRDYLGLAPAQCEFVRTVLLARGVNKWLKVRRDLIGYKKQLRHAIKNTEAERLAIRHTHPVAAKALKERSKALQECRATLKRLCMTDRWQVWPKGGHISEGMREMQTIRARD